ncbi:MAG: YraN family protein [Candidatus Moranbacteria bacterium CG_4_10_14_3_um_filter_44_15]|nr:MAG: YraN family protein [Candidatus Moranbacteria bacterium CG06_land_8_20_14_3_00_43_56]PIV84394.1 MAG: YraN family protein [Candidatus Moranbacteria bacterium CG17_big_fil_post_rev_8_21_14_2_50_44_12]PIW93412.1 MAG: YraN family protein [Candidatus Moranbacteria bacterium CG_4_8_14_3_um_filter_43_15]PIX90606.1 MAG: YraN family protein [Candidatus Moranbacteria bacterium CG_4_10_14_3_um_filter_44_15]PJA85892.1 MAG: YraN family protein [Candidatus Moranbacteria bacterium CG_4_9_14_3_um_filte
MTKDKLTDIKEIGNLGERIAANYFRTQKCEILETNFENKFGYRLGEIDIVARDAKNNEIIFAEVKTRQKGTSNTSAPELAINRAKYRKLSRIISNYLRKNKLLDCNYRLDAIAIELDMKTRKANLRHLKYIYY